MRASRQMWLEGVCAMRLGLTNAYKVVMTINYARYYSKAISSACEACQRLGVSSRLDISRIQHGRAFASVYALFVIHRLTRV
jgi:hypothetical protein